METGLWHTGRPFLLIQKGILVNMQMIPKGKRYSFFKDFFLKIIRLVFYLSMFSYVLPQLEMGLFFLMEKSHLV